MSDRTPEEPPTDVAERPLEELAPWVASEETLDLVRSVRLIVGGETDRFMASMATDAVELGPRFDGMKDNLRPYRPRPKGPGRGGKQQRKGRSGNPAKRAQADNQSAQASGAANTAYDVDEMTRLCRLTTKTYQFQLALGRAMAREFGPFEDLEAWSDDTLPANPTDNQSIVANRFEAYMAAEMQKHSS
jgi:hypothetical protein